MRRKKYIFIISLILMMISCDKMDETYKDFIVPEGRIYVQKPIDVKSYSGYNRVKFKWIRPIDPNVTLTRIYWDNYSDSIDVTDFGNKDSIEFILPIAEGLHTFHIKNFDENMNASIPIEIQQNSYGSTRMQALFNRPIKEALIDHDVLTIFWADADLYNGSIGQEFWYKDKNGHKKKLFLSASDNKTELSDYELGTDIEYKTIFVVDSMSIDSLKTEFEVYPSGKILCRLDKSKFKEVWLDNDAAPWEWVLRNIWDGQTTSPYGYCSHEILPEQPATVTFDTGVTSSLKQFKLFMRADVPYGGGNVKRFALWGTNEPKQDGSWDVWTKLGEFTSEHHKIEDGELFIMPDNLPAFRYYRMQVFSTWGGYKYTYIMEVDLYSAL